MELRRGKVMAHDVYFVGTDIGTLGTKSVVVDLKGRILSNDYAEYGVLTPRPLWAEQWPDVWFEAVCRTIKNAIAQANIPAERVAGATISGLYGGSGIPCDADVQPIRPCLIWMDRRATEEVAWVRKHIGVDKVFEITGNYVDSYHGFNKILWIRNNEPDVWKKTRWFLTPYGYAIYRLTGSISMDYCSAGNIGGIFDIHKRDWSEDLLQEMAIPRHLFPEKLVESSEAVGRVHKKGAELSGLAEGTPVCAGGVDCVVATLSAGGLDVGDQVAMIGTSMAYGVIHTGQYSQNLVNMPHVAHAMEKTYAFGGVTTAGGIIQWFRDQFGQTEKMLGSLVDVDPYDVLSLEAAKVDPGSDRLIVLPFFMGERAPIWDVNARGTIFGLTLYHTRGHLFRAFMEAVAYALRTCIRFSQDLGIDLRKDLKLVGGATKSELWKRIFADVTGYPILCVTGGGEAPYGDALLAAVGVGAVDSFDVINEWLSFDPPIEPDPERVHLYDAFYQQYVDLYETLKESMVKLSELP
jgi:sugar (pentulose or hexulose) kinase